MYHPIPPVLRVKTPSHADHSPPSNAVATRPSSPPPHAAPALLCAVISSAALYLVYKGARRRARRPPTLSSPSKPLILGPRATGPTGESVPLQTGGHTGWTCRIHKSGGHKHRLVIGHRPLWRPNRTCCHCLPALPLARAPALSTTTHSHTLVLILFSLAPPPPV